MLVEAVVEMGILHIQVETEEAEELPEHLFLLVMQAILVE
jgi:hypothetical protein